MNKSVKLEVPYRGKSKGYHGRRNDHGEIRVFVTVDGPAMDHYELLHRERHSPDGFNWGYGGSGAADLARSIIWDHIGKEPTPSMYQDFKWAEVCKWGDMWKITTGEVNHILAEKGWKKAICHICGRPVWASDRFAYAPSCLDVIACLEIKDKNEAVVAQS